MSGLNVCLSENLDQFHIEYQGCVGWDVAAGTALAVGQIVGDEETEFGAFLHELDSFGPAGDDLTQTEIGGLTATV